MAQRIIKDLIATRGVKIVSAHLSMHAARALLDAPGVDALVVLSETGPCGVLRQVMLGAVQPHEAATSIAGIMALAGPAISGTMTAHQAMRVMRGSGRYELPVMDGFGEVVSLVSVADLMVAVDVDLGEDLVA